MIQVHGIMFQVLQSNLPQPSTFRVICNFTVQQDILSFVCSGFLCMFMLVSNSKNCSMWFLNISLPSLVQSCNKFFAPSVSRRINPLFHPLKLLSCFPVSYSNSTFVDRQPLKTLIPKNMSSVASILKLTLLFNVHEKCKRNLFHPLNSLWIIHPR
jgi:hypothetical protein